MSTNQLSPGDMVSEISGDKVVRRTFILSVAVTSAGTFYTLADSALYYRLDLRCMQYPESNRIVPWEALPGFDSAIVAAEPEPDPVSAAERLTLAVDLLKIAREALAGCYDVVSHPADGQGSQDLAIKKIDRFISENAK